ncbi:MAG: LysR family transcriptional regulator, partial [Gammaproteobacteria bacterium]|nr:LysR family transcriptional regulator [Gammaproteobacteria bacterium]
MNSGHSGFRSPQGANIPIETEKPIDTPDLERRLISRLTVRQLAMFAATYEHRNIVKAAKFMSLHQSTLSKAVVEIEA